MKKSFRDRAVAYALARIKKNRWLKIPVTIALYIVLFFYRLGMYFAGNTKRYIAIGFALVFFFMSTSFTYLDNDEDVDVYIIASVSNEEVNDYIPDYSSDETIFMSEENEPLDKAPFEDEDEEAISTEFLASQYGISDDTGSDDSFSADDFLADFELDISKINKEDTSSFNKDAWYLILVNKTQPVPDDYVVPLVTLKGKMQCDERVKDVLLTMLDGARKDGIGLKVVSPYRDYKLQQTLFNRKVNAYLADGYSYLEAYKYASRKVIIPGASEHQLGIAFDILSNGHSTLNSAFGETEGGKWLKKHCAEYGFILRYPKGKEDITGIVYEPWHFRYVGVEAATYIMENNITLEEFIDEID